MKLIQGDCLEVMKDIAGGSIDLIITDPPYKIIAGGCRVKAGNNECSGVFNRRTDNKRTDWVEEVRSGKMFKHNTLKFSEWLPDVFRILKDGTHFYVMVNDRNMQEILNAATNVGFQIVNILVWKKNNCTPNKFYMKNTEFILMFRKGKARNINNMGTKQCLEVPNIIGGKLHPTEKPAALMQVLIENSSQKGECVLDPFMGSGTTGVACINTNRKFIGIELDEKYFKIAENRIKEITAQTTMF